jgi:8-oxo-dGTP pyrophosphatase MutT (NUDIX family)
MTQLIAPNGKPSNLTPEQYKLVRTPAFKEWFGDWEKLALTKIHDSGIDEIYLKRLEDGVSKVVDENGEPLVCYHSSKKEFNIFEKEKISENFDYSFGFHFSNDIEDSNVYGEITKSFFLKIINPFVFNVKDKSNGSVFIDINRYDAIHEIVKSRKTEKEIDGVIAYSSINGYVTMYSNQIKLADGTNTTFDTGNPDIRFEKGGLIAPNGKPSKLNNEQYNLVRTPAFKKWFGDWENDPLNSSKVIDEETKEPLLVYHGTNEEFKVFSKKGKGNRVLGYFFTTDKKFSENYGESKLYFLNIKNINNFNSEKFDSLNTRQNAENNYWQLEKDKLLEENYNGIIIDRNDFFAGINFMRKDYVAFEPNQIKLADGSNTTFDGNNPDIRYAKGGNVDYIGNDYLKKKYNHLKKQNANFEDLPEIFIRVGLPKKIKGKYLPSRNHLFGTLEAGISVYKARYSPNSKFVFVDLESERDFLRTGYQLFQEEKKNGSNDKIYLLEGKPLLDGSGNYMLGEDLEVLLNPKELQVVGELNPKKIIINDNDEDDDYKDKETFSGIELQKYPNYAKGGLIAPNGKPSGLYFTEIYNLVRTKEFKNWFGDWEEAYKTKDYEGVSKIIDENGEPLICVHNTPNEFYEFDEYEIGKNTDAGYYGKGFYFTPNVGQSRYGEIELNCFLNIKNPYFKQSSYRTYELNSDELKNQGYDGVVVYPNWIENMNFENGVDGSEEIVAYYPEQIKLGDGRNTTFDNYNSDIRFDGGGSVSNYREFYDNLQIEDGSKYIGQKFADVFPFVGKNTSPAQIRISVKEYSNLLGRLENDNYTTKGMKTADLNRLEKRQKYIDKKKYLSRFYLDPSGTIIGFDNSDNAYNDGGDVIINPTEIECHKCHWKWKVKDGGDDLFICHKCYTDNTKFYKFEGLKGEKILDTILYDKGGQILNLNQIRKGQYEAKYDEIEIHLTNPKILNGIGTNKWQLIVLYGNDSVINEWFDTKNEALKTGAILLNDFLNSNFKKGGRTIAQTPAPKKDQIKGSDKNKEGSAKDLTSAKKIKFSYDVLEKIQNSVDKHNKKHPNKKITIDSAKAVVRRGMGAYSSTHRPTISGGNENSRVAWGLARLNAFLYKIVNGKSKSGKYSQDNDLIEELGYKFEKYEIGGIFQGTPYDFDKYSTEYIGTGEGNQVFGWGLYFTDLKDVARYYMSAGIDDEESIRLDGKSLSEYNVEQEVKDQLVGIINIIFGEDKLIPTIELIKDDLILEYDEENYPEFKSVVEQSTKVWNLIKDKKLSFSGNIYSVILFKGENPYEYDLLEWEQKPTEMQILKIKNQAKKEGVNLSKLPYDLERYRDSNAIYTDLSYIISGVSHLNNRDSGKMCSKFLLRAGIDGIKYKAGTLSGMSDAEGYNYVIFDADDVTIEGKEKYADGGDIQAYKEAMGISEFKEGGEAKPKKIYVSIELKTEIEGEYPNYFFRYNEKPFEELKNGFLQGVTGVSSSTSNVAEWFTAKDCLIVMDYEKFMASNQTEIINYNDPYQLMANKLFLFKRLYGNITRYGEQDNVYEQTLTSICPKIRKEIILEMEISEGQKYRELYRIDKFLDTHNTGAFYRWVNVKQHIESPIDLTNAILEFNKLDDSYLGDGFENPVLTFNELLPLVELGIINAGRIWESEQEIIVKNRTLVLPKQSQLFFINKDEIGRLRASNQLDLVDKYKLKDLYKVYFVDRQDVEKYRTIWKKKYYQEKELQYEKSKYDLELKKDQVVNELFSIFINNSLKSFKEQYEKEFISDLSESRMFYDSESDDYQETYWQGIVLVQFILNEYIEIVQRNWKRFIESKSVENLNLYSFSNFYDEVKYELKEFFEKNKDELEKINNWSEIRGNGYLNLWGMEYLLKKSVYDYEDLPEWIDYKELSKMYLDKMGRELYRYYDKKDLPLISQYKDGGSVNQKEFVIQELDKDYKEVFQVRGYKNIGGSDFFFSRLNIYPQQNVFTIELPSGTEIGRATLNEKENYLINIRVDENYRRKGLGLNLYNFIEYVTGQKLKPSPIKISKEAQGLWIKRNPDIIFKDGGEADEPTNFWGTEAGGVLVYCSTTERYLILLRSEWVLEPNTWGIISGKLDDDETNIEDAVLREAEEETGHKLGHLIPSFIFEKPNFKFHNFVSIIEEEFTPELNWENTDYRWVKLDEMPENLHFGLKLLLQKEDLPTLVEKNKNIINKNKMDKNSFNTPLLIRLFELMREEVKSDVALHEIVENIMEIRSKGTLTMSDYDSIVGNVLDSEQKVINPNNQEVMFHEQHKEYFYEDFIDGKHVIVWLGKDYVPNKQDKMAEGGGVKSDKKIKTIEENNRFISDFIGETELADIDYGVKVLVKDEDTNFFNQTGRLSTIDSPYSVQLNDGSNRWFEKIEVLDYKPLKKYHTSWDLLIPAIAKLNEDTKSSLNKTFYMNQISSFCLIDEIDSAYKIVIQFIEWLSENNESFKKGGKVESIHSSKGDVKISLDENWYSDDTDVELVPVSELIKFREFDRKVNPKYNKENSVDNINHLKFMFQKEGVKSPLIIEYSDEDKAVLIIEGNHRLNSAIDLGMEYLPARVVLKKYGKYSPEKIKNAMKVSGVKGDQYGYIPSNMKPSKVGIQGTKSLVFGDGGIIEGRLHSECGDDGCGRKFQVGENGHVIEAERDEAVIVADAFDDNEKYTIKGTPSEVASALNVMGGGKNFDKGASIIKKGQELEIPELKKQATDTDVEDVIDSGSIIINRRSMADEKEYKVTGTPKQIASAINSINGNGVVIEKGAEIKEN